MNEETAIAKQSANFGEIERVLMTGDLSKLTSEQRVEYYNAVCKSTGINPLTRPFDYIQLNGKLTLYAKKDAADQLRKINGVSIDDVDISEVGDTYLVKVKGHDQTGRSDVEIGVVKKSDMQGNSANAQMKAVTKAKRRLTLSLCGLGWLDETEIETIPNARHVVVAETGEIVTQTIEGHAEEISPEQPAKSLQGVKSAAPEQKQPAPQPATTNPERPYSAEILRKKIESSAATYAMDKATASDAQRKIMAAAIDAIFGDKLPTRRYELCQYLTGKSSTKDIPAEYVLAVLKWLGNGKPDHVGFEYQADEITRKEAHAAHAEALKASGQTPLMN